MADGATRVESLRDRIEESEEVSEADRTALIDFSNELKLRNKEYSDYRHSKLLRHNTIMAEKVGGVADAIDDRDEAERLVRWIHDTYDNEETNRDYRVALRVFGKHLTPGDDVPDALEWISTATSSTYDPSPEPSNMLHWGTDVQAMLEACRNERDKAAIALAFDLGPRGGEFGDITVGDISDHKHGLQVTVRGKQGKRSVTLIPSVPYVTSWLNDHPAPNDDEAPLWSKLDVAEPLSRRMRHKIFEQAAKRAAVEKPITVTNFRKSSAAHLASKGMSQAHLEEHHGWVRGSRVASRYVSVFSDDASDELARVYGKEVQEDESADIAPLECPRCGKETPREKELCVWCGQALEPGAARKAEEVDQFIEDLARERFKAGQTEDGLRLMDIKRDVANDAEARGEAIDRLLDLD